jgi:hypothetical protein
MFQIYDVGFCVEEGGSESSWCDVVMLHATRVATWSQYSRNMRDEGGGLLMFDCCTQPSRNIARNMLATFAPWLWIRWLEFDLIPIRGLQMCPMLAPGSESRGASSSVKITMRGSQTLTMNAHLWGMPLLYQLTSWQCRTWESWAMFG